MQTDTTSDLSLAAIDAGFDPRVQGMTCAISASASRVAYDGADGIEIATGSPAEIAATLTAAGYRVAIESC